ncbi:MAG: hypothetical protein AB7U75_19940 [Hyphomicrobiaceae bacterium]
MSNRARPLQKTPKKRIWLTGHKSAFKSLKGTTFDQITTGFTWEVGNLLRIEEILSDPDDRNSYSHTLMLWQATCTGCGTEHVLDRRELHAGRNCPTCKAVQKVEEQKEREAAAVDRERAKAQRKTDKIRAKAERTIAIIRDYLSGLSLSEVGEKYDLHFTRVQQILKDADVPRRPQNHARVYATKADHRAAIAAKARAKRRTKR